MEQNPSWEINTFSVGPKTFSSYGTLFLVYFSSESGVNQEISTNYSTYFYCVTSLNMWLQGFWCYSPAHVKLLHLFPFSSKGSVRKYRLS